MMVPLSILEHKLKHNNNLLPNNKTIYITCGIGVRSAIALSIISKYGYKDLVNIDGGMTKMIESGI